MAKSKSKPARVDVYKGLQGIDGDLRACRQTLACAAEALGQAEGDNFEGESGELGASAIRVVERCCRDLRQIENSIDRLSIDVRKGGAS